MGGRSRERGPSLFGRRKEPIPNKILPRRMPDPNEAFAGGAMFRAAGSGISPGRIRSLVPQKPLRHSSCSRMNNFFLPPAPIPAPPGPRLKKEKNARKFKSSGRSAILPCLQSSCPKAAAAFGEMADTALLLQSFHRFVPRVGGPAKIRPAASPCLQPLLQGSLGMQIFPSCNPRLQPACSKARLAKTSPPTMPESPRRPGLTI
jgi:hypothetical protein